MIAVDTNILVYAHREELPWHEAAAARLIALSESPAPWAVPWPCVHEFFAKVTHPRIFPQPTPASAAQGFVSELLRSPGIRLLTEVEGYWETLSRLVSSGRIAGPMIHDARIAALCVIHGADELWTADRDFGRFPQLKTRNPLIDE